MTEPILIIASLSLVATGLILWILRQLRDELEDRIQQLESDMAKGLISIEARIQEGLQKLVEEGLDLPEAPSMIQQALGQWISSQMQPPSDLLRDPGSGQFTEAPGDSGDT
jgi:hypothetical protein